MPDSYLWNREGDPDPEIEQLEELLGGLRHEGHPPRFERSRRRTWFAAAAAMMIVMLGVVVTHHATWSVDPTGKVLVDSRAITMSSGLTESSTIETGPDATATVRLGIIGTATIEPSTRLRVEKTSLRESRLALENGTISARIGAPPRLFYVSTPSVEAIDLGCAYRLTINAPRGSGLLRVTHGWVALDGGRGRVFVPAGSSVEILEPNRLSVPVRDAASAEFRHAVRDVVHMLPRIESNQLDVMRATAKRDDALALWHLLRRADDKGREEIAQLIKELDGRVSFNQDAIARGEMEEIDRIGRMLGVRESRWWVAWARQTVQKLTGGAS